MHFPVGWEAANMPATTALKRHGLTFDRAFTSSCMCSPARATLFTGLMPAQHGVRFTLEDDMPEDIYSQVELDTDLTNLATLMSAAGYDGAPARPLDRPTEAENDEQTSQPATRRSNQPPSHRARLLKIAPKSQSSSRASGTSSRRRATSRTRSAGGCPRT